MTSIPIFFTFNNNYVVPAAVAFYSFLNKSQKSIFYEMFILHSDITPQNQALLQAVIKRFQNASLSFIDTKGFLTKEWERGNFDGHQKKDQFCTETIVKCFGSKFFPQYDKIIYSDVDVVFMDDISELYSIELTNKYIAAVKDPFLKYSSKELSHMKKEHYEMLKDSYFAGGIWVLNLKLMRKNNLEQKMMKIIDDEKIVKRWPDQDVINIACNNQVSFLPLNYISYPYMLDLLKNPTFTSDYSREELYDSIIHPKIIHYAAEKPWSGNPHKAELWWEIFYYLHLPKTGIFRDFKDPEILKLNRKYHKYKRLSTAMGAIVFTLVVLLVYILLK